MKHSRGDCQSRSRGGQGPQHGVSIEEGWLVCELKAAPLMSLSPFADSANLARVTPCVHLLATGCARSTNLLQLKQMHMISYSLADHIAAEVTIVGSPSLLTLLVLRHLAHPAAGSMPMSQPLTERAAAKARLQRSQNLHTASCLSAAAEPQAPFAVLLLCPTDPGHSYKTL